MTENQLTPDLRTRLYTSMVLTRKFEENIVTLSQEPRRLPGMQILANGQEAVATGIVSALEPADVIISNHRSHGHLLARGADLNSLMAEIMAKATGVNGGKAGTLHLSVPDLNILMTSTVVGAGPPLAVGAAFAQQYKRSTDITVVFFGDGAAAEGSVHEAMNLAGVWKLPLLFVCENNCWAGAQRPEEHCATPHIFQRAEGYNMPGRSVDGNDVEAVYNLGVELVAHCRSGKGPAFMEALTYRMRGHGEQDHQHYVDPAELEIWSARCPIRRYRQKLLDDNVLTEARIRAIDQDAETRVAAAVAFGDESPYSGVETALTDVFVQPPSA
ncbi:MAG: thiamine pyrophosphate-dependent dehydrogenase E1 component subunit alpha [Desulfobacterales bacterium]|nr:thiamine pyrophosphate-dependent dehydrogenase E1 component subunit alpha [Desulfobacterales bacterium]MDD4073506.1 thiamine pyrophosphate-dependent dehydrogenase E1 component subunit alpha [Desulfobacterales bacterium]MDD4394162.1 thiamine pyrophosphate-dependent dehydrogenase E1 component subunit alpha [Desulfobacterales bacterium]